MKQYFIYSDQIEIKTLFLFKRIQGQKTRFFLSKITQEIQKGRYDAVFYLPKSSK